MEGTKSAVPRPAELPAFDDLPKVAGQPQGCCWGIFDSIESNTKDELGTLNFLTPEIIKEASKEIQAGKHVQLDWPLESIPYPGLGRKPLDQKLLELSPHGFLALDDEIHINTQSGSQWDSLKHFAHQRTAMFYNGLSYEQSLRSTTNGIHNWCERGGVVGRGILVDWLRWYERTQGKAPSPITRHEITVQDIVTVMKYQKLTARPGDILLVRTGYVRWHEHASMEERKQGTQKNGIAIGVQNNEDTIRWLFEQHFSAVACDTVGFEAMPLPENSDWWLHEWLLVQWGTPIGELWNLESLSMICEEEQRWSFFLTSAPLHVKGGVASPPGAIAVF